MTSDSSRQRVFRRMVVREAGTGAGSPAIAAATRRLCEHFTERLTPMIGEAGVAAICARSLHLTERDVRGLTPVPASAREGSPCALLQFALEEQEPAAAIEAAITVLVTATALLTTFIGVGLTVSLLRETWPDDFADDTPEGTT